jgi:hypothetical protein
MQPDLEQSGALPRLLQALPDNSAPPYDWDEFRSRAERRAVSRRERAGSQARAALAVIAVGMVAFALRLGEPLRPATHASGAATLLEGRGAAGAGSREAPLQATRADPGSTEVLERWLASLPQEPAVVRVGNRVAVTGLEDRLAEVDDLLTAERIDRASPARLLALQRERRELVSSLAQVRYAETLANASR